MKMLKKIKIFYSNPYNSDSLSESFIYSFLPKNVNIINAKNENEAELIISHIHQDIPKYNSSKKAILICGENLYYPINLFKIIETFFKRMRFNLRIIHSILPRKILNISLFLARRKYLGFLKKSTMSKNHKIYAILTNKSLGRNLFAFPFFLQVNQISERINQLKNKHLPKIKKDRFCCFIVSNESSFERIDFFKELSKYKKVDCFGSTSLTNADNSELPKGCFENFSFFSRYKFVICFENSFDEDYITEKLPNVMLGGAIPIYRGANNIGEYFNKSSFINFEEYGKSYKKMIRKIRELDQNDRKYAEFLSRPWMTEQNKTKVDQKQKELKSFIKKIFLG